METKKPSVYYSKVTCPRLPKVIKRKGCLKALADAKDRKIIYISGKPGQGKTTLALSWLKETRIKPAWITLDENDNDPANFFLLLKEAFSAAFTEIAFDPPPIPMGAPYDAVSFARTYCSSLFAQAPKRFALVLDQFHSIREDSSLYPAILSIADTLRPNIKLVIISRSLPTWFIAKFLASHQLFHISGEDLRFSEDEIIELFKNVLKIPINPSQAKTLNKITNGQVSGLILLQEKVRKSGGAILDESIALWDSDETLADYFYHEVFFKLDEPIKALMLKTSFFDRFSVEEACRITGSNLPRTQIEFLKKYYLLSEIQIGKTLYYCYDPLIRQFIKAHIMVLSVEKRHNLVNQTGAILEEEGRIEEAIILYLTHNEDDHAIRLIEKIGLKYTLEGMHFKLKQWIRSIPYKKIRYNPWLQYFLAAAEKFDNPSAAIQFYGLALKGFEQAGNIEGQLWGLASRIITRFYMGQDFHPLEADARLGRKLVRYNKPLSPSLHAFFLIADSISMLISVGRPKSALKKALAAADIAYQAGVVPLYIRATIYAAAIAFHAGEFRLSATLFSKIEETVHWNRINPVFRTEGLIYRGILESFLGMREKALSSFTEAVKVCLENGLTTLLFLAQGYLIRQRVIMGLPLESTDEIYSMKRQILRYGNQFAASFLYYISAISHFRSGKSQEAVIQAEEAIRLLKSCHTPFIIYALISFLGFVYLENGDLVLAEQYLSRALRGLKRRGGSFLSFWALLGLAKLSLDKGEDKKARRLLTKALPLGREEGYREADGFTQRSMQVILTKAREWGIEPEYVDALMQHWDVTPIRILSIHTLGRFAVAVRGKVIPQRDWKGRKTQLFLIAFLILCGRSLSRCGSGLPKEEIIDLIWPDAEGDLASTNFYTTFHRFQTVLGHNDLISLKGGLLFLNPEHCYLDSCAFERLIHQAKKAEDASQLGDASRYLKEAKALYQGEYLPMFKNEAWIETTREALHKQFIWVEERLNDPRYK